MISFDLKFEGKTHWTSYMQNLRNYTNCNHYFTTRIFQVHNILSEPALTVKTQISREAHYSLTTPRQFSPFVLLQFTLSASIGHYRLPGIDNNGKF